MVSMDVRLVLKAPALWRIPILCCALPSGTEWYSWLLVLVGVWTCTSPLLSLDTPLLTLLSPTDADPTVLVRCSYEFEFELTRELRDAPLCSCQLPASSSSHGSSSHFPAFFDSRQHRFSFSLFLDSPSNPSCSSPLSALWLVPGVWGAVYCLLVISDCG